MPIECQIEIKSVNQEVFHQLDKSVMRHAFDIHNSMGRFFDERIYQNELALSISPIPLCLHHHDPAGSDEVSTKLHRVGG
jgi:hypothetical protein